MKMLSNRIKAKRAALFCSLSFAKDMEEIASKPIISANHCMYSGCPLKFNVIATLSAFRNINTINTVEEINKEIRVVLYTDFFSSSLCEKRKKAVSMP